MNALSPPIFVALVSVGVFSLAVAAMAVGVMAGRRSIGGSCGGLANQTKSDGSVSCSLCENPDAACSELERRMEGGRETG